MENIKHSLSNRFFYVKLDTDGGAQADRMFPMSRLQAISVDSTGGSSKLRVSFDDASVGDHTTVTINITADKGKEATKNIVDAINSTQKIVILGNNLTKESVIDDFVSVSLISEGNEGTFTMGGNLIVNGTSTFTESLQLGQETQTGADAGEKVLDVRTPISYLATGGAISDYTLAAPDTVGLLKVIIMTVDGGDATLTITGLLSGASVNTVVFTDIGQSITLVSGAIADGTKKWILVSRDSAVGAQAHNAVTGLPATSIV